MCCLNIIFTSYLWNWKKLIFDIVDFCLMRCPWHRSLTEVGLNLLGKIFSSLASWKSCHDDLLQNCMFGAISETTAKISSMQWISKKVYFSDQFNMHSAVREEAWILQLPFCKLLISLYEINLQNLADFFIRCVNERTRNWSISQSRTSHFD